MESRVVEDSPISGLARARFPLGDLEKTRAFYTNVLGFREMFDLKDETGRAAGVGFRVNDEQRLEFSAALAATPVRVTFGATDVAKLRRTLEQRGLAPSRIAKDAEGNRSFSLEGLDHHLEFVQFAAGSARSKPGGARSLPRHRKRSTHRKPLT
ncbi:MAG: VOC family protein [Candidatus Sumerlaeota bacterium]|nr:VOC family protein [Candidatus Sumerlaeota bacterium]